MANVAMWGKALKTIPRLNKSEWDALDVISKWLISTRAAVFIMTVISGIIGGLLAYYDGQFILSNFIVALIGLTFAHASNNLINDLIDHRKGIDKDNYYRSLYGPQPLEHGFMSKSRFYTYIAFTLGIALLSGVYLILNSGPLTIYLLLAGLFFVIFYTWPLKYIGLGEPSVILVWGPLMIGGTYYVVTGNQWSWDVVNIALAYAIGPTTVLFGKHTDKLKEDRKKRVFTLPVILGERISRFTTIGLWISQYFIIGYLVWQQAFGIPVLIILLALPKLFWASKIFSKPRPIEEPDELEKGVWPLYLSAHAFAYNRQFSLLFLLGIILDLVLTKTGIL